MHMSAANGQAFVFDKSRQGHAASRARNCCFDHGFGKTNPPVVTAGGARSDHLGGKRIGAFSDAGSCQYVQRGGYDPLNARRVQRRKTPPPWGRRGKWRARTGNRSGTSHHFDWPLFTSRQGSPMGQKTQFENSQQEMRIFHSNTAFSVVAFARKHAKIVRKEFTNDKNWIYWFGHDGRPDGECAA
jgi:hypothetical protein